MKFRKRKIFTGKRFDVPPHIVRIDQERTHGWQLRYGTWKFFGDGSNDGSGAPGSLARASAELGKRIARLPAPTRLKTQPMPNKKSNLPVGVSGPAARLRTGRNTLSYCFQVSIPLPGGGSTTKSVYIGTENTINKARIKEALAKAIALRVAQARKIQIAATRSKRASAAAAGLVVRK